MISCCTRDNIAALRQGLELVRTLGAARYRERVSVCYNASPGGHLRHVIEHYESLLNGIDAREVDYESRPRDALIEEDSEYAADRLQSLVSRLEAIAGTEDGPLRVRVETAPANTPFPWASSSLLRELEFLLSHTIHHYSLIAVMCRILGHSPHPDFGVAPSTLRYRQSLVPACAP